MQRADCPFKVWQKIKDNVYKLELPAAFGVSHNFNIENLKLYLGKDYEFPVRTTKIQEGEVDDAIPTNVTPITSPTKHIGPVHRARPRQEREKHSYELHSHV